MDSNEEETIENEDDYGEFSENSSCNNQKIQNQNENKFKINIDIQTSKKEIKENINKNNKDNFNFYNENEFSNPNNNLELEQKIQKELLKQKIEEMGRNSSKKSYDNFNYFEKNNNFEKENNVIKEQNKEIGEDYENEKGFCHNEVEIKEQEKIGKKNIFKKNNKSEQYIKVGDEREGMNAESSKIFSNRYKIEKSISFEENINSKSNNYISYKTDNVEIYGKEKSKKNINNENQNKNKIMSLNIPSNVTSIYNSYINTNNSRRLNNKSFDINNTVSGNFSSRQLRDCQSEHIQNKLEFNDLLKNKTFRKFLKNKIKDYKKDNQIPKNFIDNLDIIDEKTIYINEGQNANINKVYNNSIHYNLKGNDINKKKILLRPTENKIKPFNRNRSYNKSFNYNVNFESNINKNYEFEKEKNSLLLENKNLMNKIMSLQNEIQYSKKELYDRDSKLKNYLNVYDKITNENKINNEKIDELKKELNNQKNEMQNKINKIAELENTNSNLKTDLSKLQKNFDLETSSNKETKQNYEAIKLNYNDIKNKYDLLNIKYKTLSDENFNFRRDKELYEKQLKSKNIMIDNLLYSTSPFKKIHLNNEINGMKINVNSYLDLLEEENDNFDNKSNKINESNGIETEKKESEQKKTEQKEIEKPENDEKFAKMTFPELQSKRDELTQERKDIANIYSKIPLKTNRIEQINKREQLEKRLKEIAGDLAKIKLRLKNFNN